MAWDELDRQLGVAPDEEEEVPAVASQDDLTAPENVRVAQSLQVDPNVLAARGERDKELALANIMQGITQATTALGSQGRVHADTGAFDAVRQAANKKVDEVSKDVMGNRKLVSDYMKQKTAEARQRILDERDERNYQQRERAIKATAINQAKPTDNQSTAAAFAKRLEQAEADFDDLQSKGYDRADTSTAIKSMLPGFAQSENSKRQDQAERNFVNALLRKESGAAISKDEFKNAELQYFPRAGDTDAVKQQKLRNRQQALESLKASSGNAYAKIPLITDKQAGAGSFPRQVRKGNQVATVSNQNELKEANAEGFH